MAEKKYLDSGGLTTLVSNIKSKVETITNQLDNKKATKDELASAESRITAAEKDIDAAEVLLQSISSKLGGISSGAEVNQNAFSNVKVGSTTVAADAKQDTLELVAGTNVTISADAATDKISISAKDTTYGEATTSAAGLMSATDKTNLNSAVSKLSGISSGAEVNQNAFSNVKVEMGDDSTTIVADTKTDTLTLVVGDNITIETDAANDKISISAKDTTYSVATTSAAGLMSATDKTNLNSAVSKLSGISSGAEVNQNAFSNVKVGSTTVAADAKQDTLELVAGTNITIDADVANDKISISTTAEVNQNAFSNVKVGSTTVAADAKQDTLELVAGTNITISADAATDKISISAKDTTYSEATTSAAGLMSATDKTNLNSAVSKLSGISSGAEVNQNSFSNVKVGSTTVVADTKQDTLELVAGSNITISADATTDKISISAKDTTYGEATTSAAGLMSATDKTNLNSAVSKLSGIAAGAEVNQNSFSNVKVGSTTVAADAKQDTLELVAGSNITISADTATDKISISHDEEGPSSGYTSGNTTTSISGSGGSGTIKIPQLTVDKYGHVTAAADESVTITMPTIPTIPNSFANIKVGSDTVAADAKQDTVELVQGPAIVIDADTANDKISISHDEEGPSSGYTSGNTTTSISGSGGSGTIKIPQLTVDKYGHVTAAADENVTITIPSTLKNPKALKFGSKTYDGSAEAEITAADLGLASALKYHGTTTTAISDGSTTNPIVIGGSNHTATQGCVVAYGKKEFVWTGSAWEELGNEGNYKVVQTAVADPSASGSTTAFIDTISQDTNGKITVTKKNVNFPSLASYVTGPGSSTANHVAVFNDATGKVIKDSGFTIGKSVPSNAVFTDRSVTSASYHYTPAEDTNSAISASGGSATNITGTGGKLNVVTGLKRDAKGHIVGVTSANIYSTDNNTNHYPTKFTWTNGTTAGPTGSLTGTGMSAVSFGAIPSASASISGVVTTGAQTFAGSKTFTDNITILADDNDRFINFKSTPNDIDSYSWRIGYLGSGQGDNNALTFQTSKTGSWVDALKFTLPGDATFSQSVTATKFITKNGTSSQVVKGDGSLENENSLSVASAGKLTTARTIGLGIGATGTATSFDGSGNITIPVTDIKEAYLSWGGTNYNGGFGPIDAAMVPQLGANRLAFLNPDAVLVEYSTNGGSSWSTYSADNWQKVQLFNGQGSANLVIGGASQTGVDKTKHMVRITITTERQVYTTLNKFVIYVSTNGSSGCYCTIAARTQANVKSNTNTWTTFANNINISGWAGYNVINTDGITTYGNQDSQYGQVRFTFGISTHSQTYGGLTISSIMGFGGVGWATPSNLAKEGTIYSYDWQQNVTFPAKVTATTLSGSLDASNLTGTVAKARLGAHSHAYTPAGTIGNTTATGTIGNATAGGSVSSTFTGTAHNHGFTGTAHKHTFTGTAHKHTFTGTAATSGGPSGTTSVYSITGVGSLPSCTLPSTTVSYSNGELSITHNAGSFSAGSLPTRSSVTVASSNHTHSVTATGTIGNTTARGSVSSTFTGTAHNHSFTGTAHNHSFTGTAGTATTIS